MTPLDDPRPFGLVLHDWMLHHRLGPQAVANLVGASHSNVVTGWLGGGRVTYEPALRVLMLAVDAGLVTPPPPRRAAPAAPDKPPSTGL